MVLPLIPEFVRNEDGKDEPPQGKPCGIFSKSIISAEVRSYRKFIIWSGLIPNCESDIFLEPRQGAGY